MMVRVFGLFIGLLLLCGCGNSTMRQKELTRVIVARKTVQTKDTILSRLGIELNKIDSIVAAEPKREIVIKDLTGYDSEVDTTKKVEIEPTKSVAKQNIDPEVKIESTEKREESVAAKVSLEVKPVVQGGNYHVIVASFPNESLSEAKKVVERLKVGGADGAKLVITETRVRVAYSSHQTMAIATEARDALAESQPKYKDCWVLKRVM